MTWSQSLKTAAAAAFLCAVIAAPVLAAPADRPAIATEQIGGTILSVTPQIAYESATLRVSGPGGYALTKRFPPGTPISADLLTEAELTEGASAPEGRGFLPDGRYRYEVVLTTGSGESRPHTGMFFVESGAAIGRDVKQAELAVTRRALANAADADQASAQSEIGTEGQTVQEFLFIEDADHNQHTNLQLGNYSNSTWLLINDEGVLRVAAVVSTIKDRLVVDSYGRVGIGTTTPQQELHIHNAIEGGDIRLSGNYTDWVVGTFGGGNFVVQDRTSVATNVLQLEKGAPANSLVIGADGRVGIGTTSPAADFDVRGHVRGTTFASASSRELKTGFQAVDPAEILLKLSELPVTSWRYKNDDQDETHIGPVAEDFQRLFGLGDGETIANVDAVGVLMAAVQALQNGLQHKDREIERLTARVAALEARPTDTARPSKELAPSTTQGGLP